MTTDKLLLEKALDMWILRYNQSISHGYTRKESRESADKAVVDFKASSVYTSTQER